MGADFIGYILVGPEHLKCPAPLKRKMLKAAEKMVKNCNEAMDSGEYEGLVGVQDQDEAQYIAGLAPEVVLRYFLELWDGGYARDLNWRTAKIGRKTVRILSAGEPSWGDEPDGHAYQTIKAALTLNFCIPLGIQ
jgi:hypothetical protein